MRSFPLVYIVMPCYNSEKYLLEQLMSIYYQNYTNWYLIFVNDWSTDSSEEIIRNWISNYDLYDKVKVIIKENGGVNSAIQRWLEEVKNICDIYSGDSLVSYCDSDDIWTREKLDVQVKYMVDHPECDLSYHDLTRIDENGRIITLSIMRTVYPQRDYLYEMIIWNFITSTEIIFRPKYINDILPMPIWFWMCQDYWTTLVFFINLYNVQYINKNLALYRSGHSSIMSRIKNSNQKKRNDARIKIYYYLQKRFPKKNISNIIKYNEDRYISI